MPSSDSSQNLLLHMFVVSPIISWILKPGRFGKTRAFYYAVCFLVVLAVVTITYDFQSQEDNFYHIVGVDRDASYADIKRAFRVRSVELHPDKNPSATATEDFNRLRLAFDVLGDGNKRPLYDRFGEDAVEKDLAAVQLEAVVGSLTYYAIWAVLTFVLTMDEKARTARAWSLAGGILCVICEMNLVFGGGQLPSYVFPRMTIHDFTIVLHSALPPFLNGCRAVGGYFHHDLARENFALSVELLKSNQAILLSMRQLQGEVASSARRRPEAAKVAKTDSLPAAARKRLKMEKHPAAHAPAGATEESAAAAEELLKVATPEPEVQKAAGWHIPRFMYFVGVYVIWNYVLN